MNRRASEYRTHRDKGGPVKACQVFGDELDLLLKELNEELVA